MKSNAKQTTLNFFLKSKSTKKNEEVAKASITPFKENVESESIKKTDQLNIINIETEIPMPLQTETTMFQDLCLLFSKIEKTSKRLEIIDLATDYFIKILKSDKKLLVQVIYLCINRIAPDYENVELGIGENIIIKCIAKTSGREEAKIKQEYKKLGDLGVLSEQSSNNQKKMFEPKKLTIKTVFEKLVQISKEKGNSAVNRKINAICFLMSSCSGLEMKYLTRLLSAKMRIGLAEKSILVALANAFYKIENENKMHTEKKLSIDMATEILKSAYNETPNYEKLVNGLIDHGIFDLRNHCKLTPGIPIKPMLAHPTKSLSEVLDRFEGETFTCEYKYDGERVQIHHDKEINMVFSRNSENITEKYPDIISNTKSFIGDGIDSFIMDCEAVAYNKETKKILTFQTLSTRKRKNVNESEIKIKVCIFVFDLLFLNGKSLLALPFVERRKLLFENFKKVESVFSYAMSIVTNTVDDMQSFLDESIAENCEGIMVKILEGNESTYEPSKRSRNWLKVKKDYLDGCSDTFDLVVIGAFLGRGKRNGVYGGYLLASYNHEEETYESICKIGTGFSEADLEIQHKLLQNSVISQSLPYYSVHKNTKPDIWFSPKLVFEVKAADLSISPIYYSGYGIINENKGISLRFPAFVRIRDDKNPEDATTGVQVAEMYNNQFKNKKNNSVIKNDIQSD